MNRPTRVTAEIKNDQLEVATHLEDGQSITVCWKRLNKGHITQDDDRCMWEKLVEAGLPADVEAVHLVDDVSILAEGMLMEGVTDMSLTVAIPEED